MTMDVGQSPVDTVVADSELFMVNAEQVEHGGIHVVNLGGVFPVEWFVAPLVAFSMGYAALDATAGQPVREDVWIMVTAFTCLGTGHATELRCPVDNGILQQTTLLEVLNEACSSSGHAEGKGWMVASHVLVTVPVSPRETIVVATPYLDESDTALDEPAGDEALAAKVLGLLLWIYVLGILRLDVVETI